nr:MAG TPA: hypothetical protein [Caudoviricetes sp.]
MALSFCPPKFAKNTQCIMKRQLAQMEERFCRRDTGATEMRMRRARTTRTVSFCFNNYPKGMRK